MKKQKLTLSKGASFSYTKLLSYVQYLINIRAEENQINDSFHMKLHPTERVLDTFIIP